MVDYSKAFVNDDTPFSVYDVFINCQFLLTDTKSIKSILYTSKLSKDFPKHNSRKILTSRSKKLSSRYQSEIFQFFFRVGRKRKKNCDTHIQIQKNSTR